MLNYAIIDKTNKCVGMTKSKNIINHPYYILIDIFDDAIINSIYVNNEWSENIE